MSKANGMLLFWCLTISPAALAEVYKCTSQYGIVNFSDQPCGSNSQTVELQEAPMIGTQLDPGYDDALFYRFSETARKEQEARDSAAEKDRQTSQSSAAPQCPPDYVLRDNARFGTVELCMTEEMVLSATSSFAEYDLERWMDQSGQWARWHFRTRRANWPYSVVFQNGRVVRVVQQFDPYDGYYVPADVKRHSHRAFPDR